MKLDKLVTLLESETKEDFSDLDNYLKKVNNVYGYEKALEETRKRLKEAIDEDDFNQIKTIKKILSVKIPGNDLVKKWYNDLQKTLDLDLETRKIELNSLVKTLPKRAFTETELADKAHETFKKSRDTYNSPAMKKTKQLKAKLAKELIDLATVVTGGYREGGSNKDFGDIKVYKDKLKEKFNIYKSNLMETISDLRTQEDLISKKTLDEIGGAFADELDREISKINFEDLNFEKLEKSRYSYQPVYNKDIYEKLWEMKDWFRKSDFDSSEIKIGSGGVSRKEEIDFLERKNKEFSSKDVKDIAKELQERGLKLTQENIDKIVKEYIEKITSNKSKIESLWQQYEEDSKLLADKIRKRVAIDLMPNTKKSNSSKEENDKTSKIAYDRINNLIDKDTDNDKDEIEVLSNINKINKMKSSDEEKEEELKRLKASRFNKKEDAFKGKELELIKRFIKKGSLTKDLEQKLMDFYMDITNNLNIKDVDSIDTPVKVLNQLKDIVNNQPEELLKNKPLVKSIISKLTDVDIKDIYKPEYYNNDIKADNANIERRNAELAGEKGISKGSYTNNDRKKYGLIGTAGIGFTWLATKMGLIGGKIIGYGRIPNEQGAAAASMQRLYCLKDADVSKLKDVKATGKTEEFKKNLLAQQGNKEIYFSARVQQIEKLLPIEKSEWFSYDEGVDDGKMIKNADVASKFGIEITHKGRKAKSSIFTKFDY